MALHCDSLACLTHCKLFKIHADRLTRSTAVPYNVRPNFVKPTRQTLMTQGKTKKSIPNITCFDHKRHFIHEHMFSYKIQKRRQTLMTQGKNFFEKTFLGISNN